ncbi:hypothetical protein JTB14_029379 [Gonioctena quinquepunctata]|nr:hypothetical protein JTB14_029379 [Gonioctena quinquepunctata]
MEDDNITPCEQIILWSDCCGGQNRNIEIVSMMKAILEVHSTVEKITLRLLISGQSFSPNDADFSDIECALKLQQRMYSPEDYCSHSTAESEKSIANRKVDLEKNKVN